MDINDQKRYFKIQKPIPIFRKFWFWMSLKGKVYLYESKEQWSPADGGVSSQSKDDLKTPFMSALGSQGFGKKCFYGVQTFH